MFLKKRALCSERALAEATVRSCSSPDEYYQAPSNAVFVGQLKHVVSIATSNECQYLLSAVVLLATMFTFQNITN